MRPACRGNPNLCDNRHGARQTEPCHVAKVCRESKMFCDDIYNTVALPCSLAMLGFPPRISNSRPKNIFIQINDVKQPMELA
jgi:hypothetical protein